MIKLTINGFLIGHKMANGPGGHFDGTPGPGRPKGSTDKAKSIFKERLNQLLEDRAPDFLMWIDRVAEDDPAEALKIVCQLAEYCYPKLARSENTVNGTMEQIINVFPLSSRKDERQPTE